ncbi:Protein of unknown function [Clostridium cavendishii DSM 21758]|uniref:DUF3892 domain-containing protein n=1 Tax=Clostridium cavendishii DSM 21758 TaxID=1121302 RepID=A0A1M6CTI4_9CLOT|nr:DUF3892 domain-containing protein [Clostridium cavendishii]SHI64395.1 Protein of unknown function [Clostridium cavendishii DSM 21758]
MSIDTVFAHTITEIIRNNKGEITAYKLENGERILKEEAISLARQGVIKGIQDISSKKEDSVSLPDGDGNNNLGELPIIK